MNESIASGGEPISSPSTPKAWREVLRLSDRFERIGGGVEELRNAVRAGSDLRIYSEFRHNEHIDTTSACSELIRETMDMRTTYLIEDRWAAGALTLRQPVELPHGFGPRPSLSLFLYNEDGSQAVARPFLDGAPAPGARGPSAAAAPADMPRYEALDAWDTGTNAPSSNFRYAFDRLRYLVREDWTEVLHTDRDGGVRSGSLAAMTEAFSSGCEWKVGIRGICADLPARTGGDGDGGSEHELFIQGGSCYLYTERRLLIVSTHPFVRVTPAIPLRYTSSGWDYAWAVARSDGKVALLAYNPYTLLPTRTEHRCEVRWFCR